MTKLDSTEILTEQQAATMLNLPPRLLREWRSTKRVDLPFLKFGRLVRYTREDIETFIRANVQ